MHYFVAYLLLNVAVALRPDENDIPESEEMELFNIFWVGIEIGN